MPSLLDKAPRLSISIVIWILSSDTDSSNNFIQIVRRQCCLVFAHLDVVVHLAFHQLLPILMFVTLLTVDGKWNPKTTALTLLTIGTLTLSLLKFFMKQTDGALKQDCRGVNSKHHAAERLGFGICFSNTIESIFTQHQKS